MVHAGGRVRYSFVEEELPDIARDAYDPCHRAKEEIMSRLTDAQLTQFNKLVHQANPDFERRTTSSLHPLMVILGRDSTAAQVVTALKQLPAKTMGKYRDAITFLRQTYPGLGTQHLGKYDHLEGFMQLVVKANPKFERIPLFGKSHLHTLIDILERDGATPPQVANALRQIPGKERWKYRNAISYLQGTYPGLNQELSDHPLPTSVKNIYIAGHGHYSEARLQQRQQGGIGPGYNATSFRVPDNVEIRFYVKDTVMFEGAFEALLLGRCSLDELAIERSTAEQFTVDTYTEGMDCNNYLINHPVGLKLFHRQQGTVPLPVNLAAAMFTDGCYCYPESGTELTLSMIAGMIPKQWPVVIHCLFCREHGDPSPEWYVHHNVPQCQFGVQPRLAAQQVRVGRLDPGRLHIGGFH